jgi:AcrR family transcriptional regulator
MHAAATGEASTFETQGERRRAQMVTLAAKLVVAGGPEAVTHAAVAEQAGVHRTAVYRYFPARDDLLAAVIESHGALLARTLGSEELVTSLLLLAGAAADAPPPEVVEALEKQWDTDDWTDERLELRLAAIVLQRDNELRTRLESTRPHLAERRDESLLEPLRVLGLSATEQRIVIDAFLVALSHATTDVLAGTIDRGEALRVVYRMTRAAVQAFLD